MKKIVITGPESTGKTTLARQLAAHYGTKYVPEYARIFLENLDRPYTIADLLPIAKGQLDLENQPQYQEGLVQICDTSFLVLKVWLEFKYNTTHPWVDRQFQNHPPDLYLLCDIDLPWQPDPFRENPNELQELMDLYRAHLENAGFRFAVISGKGEERFQKALQVVEEVVNI